MKHIKLFEMYNQFSVSSNLEILSLISYFGNNLKNYSERDMKDHYRYKSAITGLNTLKEEIEERIERYYRSENDEIGRIANDMIKDINRDENKFDFSIGMWKTILKTIDATIDNNKFTPIVEDDDDYVLYDEEKEYLNDIFKKYLNQSE